MAGVRGHEQVTLKIPRPLYERLKQVISDSGFHSVTEFAVYVLRDLASHHEEGGTHPVVPESAPTGEAPTGEEVEPLSPAEIEAIRKRLESLGYL
jgi:Arc/MetJ-type ribon-helix-helix transcriptional regulator